MNGSVPPSTLLAGLDLGGTKLLGVVVDPDRDSPEPLVELRVPTPSGADDVLAGLTEVASSLAAEAHDRTGRQVRAVGLGAPGLVDRTGTFRFGPNLPGVEGIPIAAELGERLGLPVVVDNDATCAAWGEHERGAARGRNHSLLATLGTGIGGGITIKGEILRGAHGFAGEIGHMVVDAAGPECPCGRNGCWERYASGSGMGWLARDALAHGRAATDGPMVVLAGGDIDAVRGEHVTAAGRAGDPDALAVLDAFGGWLGTGIANLLNVLDSEVVVIGGGVSAEADLFLDQARRTVREVGLGGRRRPRVPVVVARLGERAGAIGAALLAGLRT